VANLDLFVEVLANVELAPDSWDQSNWFTGPSLCLDVEKLPEQYQNQDSFYMAGDELEGMIGLKHTCETAACIAGWACLLSGAKSRWCAGSDGEKNVFLEADNRHMFYKNEVRDVSLLACELLEIYSPCDDEDRDLFHGHNDKDDVYSIGAGIFLDGDVDQLYILVEERVLEIEADRAKFRASLKKDTKAEISA